MPERKLVGVAELNCFKNWFCFKLAFPCYRYTISPVNYSFNHNRQRSLYGLKRCGLGYNIRDCLLCIYSRGTVVDTYIGYQAGTMELP